MSSMIVFTIIGVIVITFIVFDWLSKNNNGGSKKSYFKQNTSSIKNNEFPMSFLGEQKKAVIYLLEMVVTALYKPNSIPHDMEEKLNRVGRSDLGLWDYTFNSPLYRLSSNDTDKIFESLKTLSTSQKEWLSGTVKLLISSSNTSESGVREATLLFSYVLGKIATNNSTIINDQARATLNKSSTSVDQSGTNKSGSFQQPKTNLEDWFSPTQKGAILGLLITIANNKASGQVTESEITYLEKIGLTIGVDYNNLNSVPKANGFDHMLKILGTLDQSQLKWLIFTTHGMVVSDGNIDRSKAAIMLNTLTELGISQEQCTQTIKEVYSLTNLFS